MSLESLLEALKLTKDNSIEDRILAFFHHKFIGCEKWLPTPSEYRNMTLDAESIEAELLNLDELRIMLLNMIKASALKEKVIVSIFFNWGKVHIAIRELLSLGWCIQVCNQTDRNFIIGIGTNHDEILNHMMNLGFYDLREVHD